MQFSLVACYLSPNILLSTPAKYYRQKLRLLLKFLNSMFMMKLSELSGSKHIHNLKYFTRFQTSATVHAPSSGTLSDVSFIGVTDVLGQPIGSIFKVQAVQAVFLDRSTHEDGTCRLFRNVGNSYQNYVALTSPRTANA